MNKVIITAEDFEYLKRWAKENPDKRFTLHIPFEDVLIETKDPEYPFMKTHFRAKVCLENGKLPFPFVAAFDAHIELDANNIITYSFIYSYATASATTEKVKWGGMTPQEEQRVLGELRSAIANTYTLTMAYINASEREVIQSVRKVETTVVKKKGKRVKTRHNHVISIDAIRKIYESRPKPAEPRGYTKPEYAVSIRGHWRNYKSGKKVWIEPHYNYKDKPKKEENVYRIKQSNT